MPETDPLPTDKQHAPAHRSEENKDKASIGLIDNPTTKDLLGFSRFANSIAENIIKDFSGDFDTSTCRTIGVYGEWGSGKTSFLQMIAKCLNEKSLSEKDQKTLNDENLSEKKKKKLMEKGTVPIWFDAWKYDKEDNLWAALMQKILDQAIVKGIWYQRGWVKFIIWKDSIKLRQGLWEVLKKISPVFFKILLIVISLYIIFALDSKTIAAFLNQWFPNNSVISSNGVKVIAVFTAAIAASTGLFNLINLFKGKLGIDFSKFRHKPSYREHIAFLDEFSKEFEKIIRLIGQRRPLVIIIDDLDRCLPEKTIQVIEAIKIFLDVKGCVFLLALDRNIVEKAVAVKYKDMISLDSDNKNDFFQKKTVFYKDYTDKFIQLAILLPRLSQQQIKEFVTQLSTDKDIKKCASIFGAGLSSNPRRIKRILRTFLFVRDMIVEDIKTGKIKISLLAKLIVIQGQQPDIFNMIIQKHSLLEELEKVYCMQDGNKEQENPTEEDKLLQDQAEKYVIAYPELRQILLTKIDEDDTFINIDMQRYIALIGVLAVVGSPPSGYTMRYIPGHKYRLIEEIPDRTGWCSDCDSQVKIVNRWYVDMQSGSIGKWKVRLACNCTKEGDDPFKANIAPPFPIRPSKEGNDPFN